VLDNSAPPNPHMRPARSINRSTTEARRCTPGPKPEHRPSNRLSGR
jgi:hypothetical protein